MKEKTKKPLGFVISENVECLAIAIAMALILKFFIIEAYKIPSGSMQPTIMGNPQTGLFDRVLVNKFIYMIDKPERWNVIVFRFPLNQSENYIKRLIGLPGEKVTIKNGDIYINDGIARKPKKVRNSVMKTVYPSGRWDETFSRVFTITGKCAVGPENDVSFATGGRATLSGIRDRYLDGYDPDYHIPYPRGLGPVENHFVGDLEVSFTVTLADDTGGVSGEIKENGRVHTFFLRGRRCARPSSIETRWAPGDPLAGVSTDWSSREISLEAHRPTRISFANIDDRLSIEVEGKESASFEYTTGKIERGNDPNAVSFGSSGSGASFTDVTVLRDIYYLNDDPVRGYAEYRVPEGHYFALGDNTQNSSDGRRWQVAKLLLKDGTTLEGEYVRGAFPAGLFSTSGSEPCAFTDIYGDIHTLRGRDLREEPQIEARSFVDEKFMLGKAMAVFWPIYPHFRWKLIR